MQVGGTSPITVAVLPISADNFSVGGTVTLYQGPANPYGNIDEGQAVLRLGFVAGSYRLTAKYSCDANLAASTSAAIRIR